MWFVLITTWLASNKLSSVKRAQTVHQSYEYPSRELVLAVGMFILAIGKKCVIIVMAHHLFQRAVIYHSKHFLGRTVGLYFCILFESVRAEPTLPPFSCGLAVAFVRGGTALATVMSDQPLHKQRRVTRGNGALYLRTGSLEE